MSIVIVANILESQEQTNRDFFPPLKKQRIAVNDATKGTTINRTEVDDVDYTVLTTDYYISVLNLTAGRTITLPTEASTGAVFIVKDASGQSGTYNITVTSSHTLDGSATAVMNRDLMSLTFVFDGTSNYEIN